MDNLQSETECPLAYSLCIFGDRWSLLILRDMILLNKQRYGEFLQSPEAISTNILAARLKQLLSKGFIEKYKDPDNAKSHLYIMSEKGISLLPVIMAIVEWGSEEVQPLEITVPIVAEYKEDRDKFIRLSIDRLKQRRQQQLLQLKI